MYFERKRRMRVLLGGPFNNQPYFDRKTISFSNVSNSGPYKLRHWRNVGKAQWAVYEGDGIEDPRLFFRGFATSEKKARNGVVLVKTAESK